MKVNKSYNELISLSNVLNSLSQQKAPFSIAIAKNIQQLKPILEDFEAKRKDIIDKYALVDEEGTILGVYKTNEETGEKERVKEPKTFNEIEWQDGVTLNDVLTDIDNLTKDTVEVVLYPIDVSMKYFDKEAKERLAIREYIDKEVEAELVLFLDNMGLLENLFEE